jgi:hypothetical protein
VIARADDTFETLRDKVRVAAILGTLQASLTNFKFVSESWHRNTEEEALLGVSITGIYDNPLLSGKKGKEALYAVLNELRDYAREVNAEWAEKLGINPSAAITCVKPSGCTTVDTEIRTTEGTVSMRDLFEKNGYSLNDVAAMPSKTWLEPSVTTYVLDENNVPQEVTKLYVNGVREVFEITFEDGKQYRFTGNHKLKTHKGWKRVDELTSDDEVVGF